MGFFKKLFGDAADELKKNLEDAKKEMLSNLEEVKQDVMGGFTNSTSNSRDNDEEDDEEPKILLGDFHDGVLTIREGITELDDESLEHYKRIRKITFPASLERLDSNVIDEQERLEELDFSKVTKLKTIPDDFISGENKVRKLIIPNGVTEVGDGFLGEAKSGAEIFVPASVRKLGYITGNNDNDMTVYLFAANIDISDVEEDVKTLYVLPQYYGWYAKALKKCDSEARLREMPEEMMGVYGATSLGELKEIAKDNASLTEDSKTESVDDNITDIVQKIKEKLQALDLSSFILYGNDYEGDREYEEVEQLGDEGLLESSSEYAINYDDSYDGNSSVYTKVRKIEIQESGVTFDIEEIYEDNDGDEESRGFHEAQTIDRILESCNRDAVERGLGNILTYLDDETLIKLNKNTGNEAKPEPVLEPKPEPKAETKVEVEQKEEPIENGGLFSARLEAMIAAALQDGVLTDKERELLKRRVEKEGEDWDEVEMIIEARLAEKQPASTLPQSLAIDNNPSVNDPKSRGKENASYIVLKSIPYKSIALIKTVQKACNLGLSEARDLLDAAPTILRKCDTIEEAIIIKKAVEADGGEIEIMNEQEINNREYLQIKAKEYVRTNEDKYATSIDIPEGVTIIPERCFRQCSSLESITLPSTIKQIGESAFSGCSALTSIDIPEGVTIIPDWCFDECSSMESITLPSTIKQIGQYAFSGCSALTSIDIPEGVTIIPDSCFYKCTKLKSVALPTTIKKIKGVGLGSAFAQCNKLKTISIPNGCERLEELGRFDSEPRIFLPPSLCSIDVISDRLLIYCFAPQLEELEIFKKCKELYVLPQYLDLYKSQAEAEEVEIDIKPMPDEYLYFYDN